MFQQSDAERSKRFVPVIYGILLLLTLAVYLPALQNDFINLDDGGYVTENPQVTRGLSAGGLRWAFNSGGYMSNWHPLTWISHQLDCQIYGLRPWGHHLTNILLHAANVLLLMTVLARMTGAIWPSAFVAAVFAWHPLHVESVAWVSERKDVLSTFFWLLTMLAYVKSTDARCSRPKLYYGLALLCFALGLMSKPMLVTLPFVLLLMDYWPLNRIAECGVRSAESDAAQTPFTRLPGSGVILEKLPFFALSAISCIVTVLAQKEAGSVSTLGQVSIAMRLETAIVSYGRYIGKTIWPAHLSVFYPPVAGWPKSTVLSSAVLLGAISVVAIRGWRKSPWLAVGWLWFLGTLVPVIGLVQVGTQSLADRYMYVPMIGLLMMVAWDAETWTRDWPNRPIALGAAAAIALCACLALTWDRVHYWRNSGTLFRQALEAAPVNNFMANACLGRYLLDEGKDAEAIDHLRAALKVAPTFYMADYGLGRALADEGKWEEATNYLSVAVNAYPNFSDAHNQFGRALAKLGKTSEAMAQFQRSIQLDSQFAEARLNLADLLAGTGKLVEAKAEVLKAREVAFATKRPDLVAAADKRLASYESKPSPR